MAANPGSRQTVPPLPAKSATPALTKESYRSTPAHHHNYTIHQRGWKVRLRSWLTIYVIYICLCTYIPIFRCSLFVTPAQRMLCNLFSFQYQLKPRPSTAYTPMSKPQYHVADIGAGLGGLAAAIGIARAGHKVTIIEQATALGEVHKS